MDFSDLSALIFNCTLKPTPELSHTEDLINNSRTVMEAQSVPVEVIRPIDYKITHGVYSDMAEQGWLSWILVVVTR